MTYYKFTGTNGTATSGNGYKWPLPRKNDDGSWTPGKWTRKIKDIELCESGYHFTDSDWLAGWIDAELYEVEIMGDFDASTDTPTKYVCHKARLVRRIEAWDEKSARLFAVRCARDAMLLVKSPDPRSVAAIDTAEKYANGDASQEDLAAARDAARVVARVVAWDAARDAAWAAARDAARAAARDAARDAAWDAAGAAARDAARAAATDAAEDAQVAAAGGAAWVSARHAASDTAWAAAR